MSLIAYVIGLSVTGSLAVVIPTVKYAMNLAPYLYANTRCSARSGFLLSSKHYADLLDANSIKEVLAQLDSTTYAELVEKNKDAISFSTALDNDLAETYVWLEDIAPKKVKSVIEAMRVKFEISELKRILNDIIIGRPVGDVNMFEDYDVRAKLQEVQNYSALQSALENTHYHEIFMKYTENDVFNINTELDKHYFSEVFEQIDILEKDEREAFLDYWSFMIDLTNIRILLRKINSKNDEEYQFIDQGNLSIDQLSSITDLNALEALLEEIARSPTHKEFANVDALETFLYHALRDECIKIASKYSLKIGQILEYIALKEIEVRNLNILVKLKSEKFEQDEIKSLIVTSTT